MKVRLFVLVVSAMLLALAGQRAFAEILVPPTLNASYATGGTAAANTNGTCTSPNLGGSTANTTNTGTLTGLGQIGPYSFNITGTIVRGTASTAVWADGLCFPTTTALRLQAVRAPVVANGVDGPGYANYQIDFSVPTKGLSFKLNGFDYGDQADFFAYNGATQVPIPNAYITPTAGVARYTPFVNRNANSGATDTNASGFIAPANTSVNELQVNFPANVAVTRIVIRYGKSSNFVSNATMFLTGFQ
jgi:hypothetical protein